MLTHARAWYADPRGRLELNMISTLRTLGFLKMVDELYGEDPSLSMVHVSKVFGVNERTIRRAVRDLGMRRVAIQ